MSPLPPFGVRKALATQLVLRNSSLDLNAYSDGELQGEHQDLGRQRASMASS